MEQRGFEIPPGLVEKCKGNPAACAQYFQKDMGERERSKVMNMNEEERMQYMEDQRNRRLPPDQASSKPYHPEGLLPMEAFMGDKDHQGMKPIDPGADATPEQRRVYQMNVERYKEFQGNPEQYQQQFEQQYNAEYQRQYNEQYHEQSQRFGPGMQPMGGQMPPEGFGVPEGMDRSNMDFRPPEHMQFQPPEGMGGPSGGMPPAGYMEPPPDGPPSSGMGDGATHSSLDPITFLAAAAAMFMAQLGF